jgi:hypothetical protein
LGGARKAMAKSLEWVGDEGVTMIAGRGDFSVMLSRERSKGAGMSM